MSRTQLPAQTLGEAVEALNWVGNWAVGGHDRTRSFSPKKENRTPREIFLGGKKLVDWRTLATECLQESSSLQHATRIIYHGKGSQSSTVLFQSPSKNLGFGSWSYSGNWKPQSYLIYPPCHQQRLPAENICQPSALLISRSAEDQIIERQHSWPTDPQTKRIQIRFPAQLLPTDSYQLAPGVTVTVAAMSLSEFPTRLVWEDKSSRRMVQRSYDWQSDLLY